MASGVAVGHLEPQDHSKQSHMITLFFLVYGAEAVIPTDLEYGSPKIKGYDESANQRAREDSLDQIDEARGVGMMHSA
jgi:hypothetical protein